MVHPSNGRRGARINSVNQCPAACFNHLTLGTIATLAFNGCIFMLMLYHAVAFLLLITAAALQLNDPDPWLWGTFYFLCALVPLLAIFNVYSRALYWVSAVFAIVLAGISLGGGIQFLRHLPEASLLHGMSPDRPYVEETRELLGALIALAIISVYPIQNRKKTNETANERE